MSHFLACTHRKFVAQLAVIWPHMAKCYCRQAQSYKFFQKILADLYDGFVGKQVLKISPK